MASFILQLCLLVTLLFLSLVLACDLKAKVISETNHPVWAQFTFHNETTSPVYEFERDGENKTVRIVGLFCNLKPTILKTYNEKPNSQIKPIGQTAAFIEGMGVIEYIVFKDTAPRVAGRTGVSCGFGDCGSHG